MSSCNAKEKILKTTEANRPRSAEAENQLAGLREQIASLDTMATVPGIKVAQNSLWEQVAAVAATLLVLHPQHSEAITGAARRCGLP